jgi:hypothetical protein
LILIALVRFRRIGSIFIGSLLTKKHSGGQPGNQNARKHGFYSGSFIGVDKTVLSQASRITGLDDEIALLRARLKVTLRNDPNNLRLISEVASTLARLVRTSQKCGFNKTENFEQVRWNILYRMGTQLGFDISQIARFFLRAGTSSDRENEPAANPVIKKNEPP